ELGGKPGPHERSLEVARAALHVVLVAEGPEEAVQVFAVHLERERRDRARARAPPAAARHELRGHGGDVEPLDAPLVAHGLGLEPKAAPRLAPEKSLATRRCRSTAGSRRATGRRGFPRCSPARRT